MSPLGDDVKTARQAAERMRAEWLWSVASGMVTPLEAVHAAVAPDGAPLRNMSLRTLLGAVYSHRQVEVVIAQLGRTAVCNLDGRYVPVRWLFDGRGRDRLAILEGLLGGGVLSTGPYRLP